MEPKQSTNAPTVTEPTTRDVIVTALLDLAEVEVEASPDDTPVRGNVLASGDDEVDAQAEAETLERLESGDVWAWAVVRVVARFEGFEADDFLGGCSYDSEADFRTPGGYFDDMRDEVLGDLADALLASGFYGAPGSVSRGTLILDDLAEAYASTLDALREARTLPPSDFDGDRLREHVAEVGRVDRLLGEVEGARTALGDAWDESAEAPEQVVDLADALDAWALPGFAFGSNEGDGSDFGYWAVESDEV